MNAHPVTLEMLADWLDGRLTPEIHQELERHLAGCARCAEELTWLQRFLRAARAEPLPEPPADLVKRARALYDRRRVRPPSPAFRFFPRVRVWPALTAVLALVIAAVVGIVVLGREGSAVVVPAEEAVSQVEVRYDETMPWLAVPPAEPMPAGSRLRVAQGSAQISLFDGSSVWMGAGTELKLARLQHRPLFPAGRQVVIEQNAGSAEYIVQPAAVPWAEFQVRVPVGSVIVRGTRFQVEVQDRERARVRVLEGVIEVVGDVDRAEVYAGAQAVLKRGAPVLVVPAQEVSTPQAEPRGMYAPPTYPPAVVPTQPGGTSEMTPRPEHTPGPHLTPMPDITPGAVPTHPRRRPTEPLPTPTGGELPIPTVTRQPRPSGTPMPAPTVMPRPTRPTWGPETPTISPWPTRAPEPTLEPSITPWATPTCRHRPGPQPSPGWTPSLPWETPTAGPPAWPTPAQTPGPRPTPEPTQGYWPSPGPGTPRR